MSKSIITRIILIFILLGIIPLVWVNILYFSVEQKENENFSKESLGKLVEEKSTVLSQDLKRVEYEILHLAKLIELTFEKETTSSVYSEAGTISIYIPTPDNITQYQKTTMEKFEEITPLFATARNRLSDMGWIYFITPDNLMFLTPQSNLDSFGYDHNFENDIYYSIATPENNPGRQLLWTTPYTDWLGKGWTITCSYPVYVNDEFLGVLSADVTSKDISSILSDFRLSDSGFAFLIDSSGSVIYHPESEAISRDKGMPLSMNLITENQNKEYESILLDMANGNNDFKNYINNTDGKLHAIAYSNIDYSGWSLGIDVNWDMYKNITGANKNYLLLISFVSIFIFTIIGILLYRLISLPISKLVTHTRTITSGDYSTRIHIGSNDEIGELESAINTMTDSISEYTENMKYKTKEMEAVFNSYPQIMMKIDKDFNILLMNNKGMDIISEPSDTGKEIIGQKCYSSIFNRSDSCENCPLKNKLSSTEEITREITNGTQLHRITSYPITAKSEPVREWVVFNSNITEKYLLEKTLVQREKMAGIGQMMAGVTHELKNPLMVIKGAEHLLKLTVSESVSSKETTDEINEIFHMIDESVTRAENIISNVLDFSRKSTENEELVDINKILEQVLLIESHSMLRSSIIINTKYDNELSRIHGNRDILKQIFINLISNAVQALPKEEPRLDISTRSLGENAVEVRIADNGSGIPKDIMDKIFKPFFSTKGKEGYGLGLWIVKREMDKMGGTIKVISDDEGTEFTLIFNKREGDAHDS
ncbi:His Kinase A (phospho-acceptor) domain-containing protein [Dethiosulfatibacter aminovorans DSM 17477]|uniref:histidine kinase n=1 Tax=Dethiosulfatibacter aminovorans DSM 17477 TaxID=1121476 RepID=A0A1M6ATH8_9FIRM|nr:HAMP domain-containing histidine kinase [Dethiosulfatibacter aminovorans]SHI39721.1 His Kinase A (phospho-acceptor) domain-containing protein [Dethiosulfatibacter aminovorans DSM 17477]